MRIMVYVLLLVSLAGCQALTDTVSKLALDPNTIEKSGELALKTGATVSGVNLPLGIAILIAGGLLLVAGKLMRMRGVTNGTGKLQSQSVSAGSGADTNRGSPSADAQGGSGA